MGVKSAYKILVEKTGRKKLGGPGYGVTVNLK
jgi:hypothetical protein